MVLDLILIKFLDRYFSKPIYVFGGFGALSMLAAVVCAGLMIYLKLFHSVSMISTPLPVLTAVLLLISIMSLLLGLLAEILVRTYFELQNCRAYIVGKVLNLPDSRLA